MLLCGVHCVGRTPIHGWYSPRLQVVARDDDQGSNSKLSYVLLGGNEDGAFTLSDSGELQVTQSLDRETKEYFVLTVTATDSGKSVLASLSCRERLHNGRERKHSVYHHCVAYSWQCPHAWPPSCGSVISSP